MASSVTRLSFIAAVAAALSTGCWGPSPESGPAAEIYGYCISCHMEDGGGKQIILAPAIAGLPVWYVEESVRKFRNGVRGSHFCDVAGMRMRPMAPTLKEDQINAVSQYVANLPAVPQPKTMEGGDAGKGKALFTVCTACHGADGTGVAPTGKTILSTNGPPLARMADWYIYEQLTKFRTGMRGADGKRDPNGYMMATQAKTTLKDEQAVKDVIAYIGTLGK